MGLSDTITFSLKTALGQITPASLTVDSFAIRYISAGSSGDSFTFAGTEHIPTPIPLPAPVFLLLGALAGLGVVARRRRQTV